MPTSGYDWNMLTALATLIYALAVVVSLPLLWLQIRRMRSAQEATIAISLHDESTNPELHRATLWLKTEMPEDFTYDQYKNDVQAREKLELL
jgi:hypothetical protein